MTNMQNTPRPRPRPGTSASPMMQQPMPQNPYSYGIPDNPDFTNFDFSAPLPSDQSYADPDNAFNYNLNAAQQPIYGGNLTANAPTSQELVRRTRNQQLAPQNGQQQQEMWNGYNNNNNMTGQFEEEDEAELERRVAAAKKDAQGKRKQIPPFVQKLSSFLDSSHTDLIRWSDDGKSFIVLDEDEFARTLIPELFKHNNYASFVRQLNMYGFHKTVNITDGSLRQSEKARKGVKPPSMYSHPYFRKNRPDLLWLIQKPTGKSSTAKRKRDGKEGYDSDEGREFSPIPEGRSQELGAPNANQELAQLPRTELAQVRQELQKLQHQQRFISQMITQLKDQNDQFYRQAANFQALHDRHENSINAILTFLATFYNRSLEGHGAQNLVNMFTNAQNQQQQHGSVVEEFNDSTPTPTNQLQRFVKRPPLLLPGPASTSTTSTPALQPPGTASTQPNSARQSLSPGGSVSDLPPDSATTNPDPRSANSASPAVKTEPPTPQMPESNDDMMNLINSVNASSQAASTPSTAAPIDFNALVDHYANLHGADPLTPQQRDSTLASIMRQTGHAGNALTTPGGAGANFDLSQLKNSRATMETLQSMQRQTADQIQNLSERLVPLSPSGSIPGLHGVEGGQDPFDSVALGDAGFDPNAFIDFGGGGGGGDYGGGEGDFDFGFDTSGHAGADWATPGNYAGDGMDGDGVDDLFDSPSISKAQPAEGGMLAPGVAEGVGGAGGGRVESVSSEATSPAATVQEVPDEAVPGTPRKRVKRS